MIDVINVNDKYYVNIDDFIVHLNNCAESVMAFTADSSPMGAKMVSDTLYATIDTLEGFKNNE
ncbi:MAG: hypothetical protein EB127_18135 [Alphaproteobacteria bacterium]|nr:hypothetical protein [Alphaproteobacteria bacterium]